MAESIGPNFASSQACNASLLANKAAFAAGGGFCNGTPSVYGIKVFKMGFCTSSPLTSPGIAVDYSSCAITFADASGVDTSFTAGVSDPLPAGGSSIPPAGSYSYAVIEIDKTFDIAAKIGPFQDGTTYYSTSTWTTSGSPGDTTGPAETFESKLTSFDPNNSCKATSDPFIQAKARLLVYLIDSSSALIADDAGIPNCSGVSKVVGVAQLNTPITITSATRGLTATFSVTNNGSSIKCSLPACSNIMFDSGPVNVAFTVVE